MLSFWRKRKSFAVHLIFWPIIAVFVIWGFERYGDSAGGAAAVVNDHTITISQYRNAVQRMVEFYNQVFQGNFDEKTQEQYHIKQNAMSQLIDTELVSEQAEKMALIPTDTEIREAIVTDPNFQKDGKFVRENYDAALKYLRMSASQFEDEERRGLIISRVNHLFDQSLTPSSLEIEKQRVLREQKKSVEFLKFDKDQLIAGLKGNSKDVDAFLKSDANIKEAKEYFDLHQAEFSKPEEVHARHILIKATKGNAAEESAAKEKIAKIQSELKTTSFENLAAKYSDDPGSKNKAGDLGWFGRGRMVPEFDKAAFSLEVGKVSNPIQTDFGFHLIKVEEKHPVQRSNFDDVKKSIAEKLIAKEKVNSALAETEKNFTSSPKDAVAGIEKLGGSKLKWQETGFFSLADDTIPKIGENPDLIEAASEVSPNEPIYPKLIKANGSTYIVRFKKAEPGAPFDEKAVTKELAANSSKDIFAAWRTVLRSKAKITVNPQLSNESGGSDDDGGGGF